VTSGAAGPHIRTRLTLVVLTVLGTTTPALAQSPVVNAKVENRAVTRGLANEVQAIADRGTPAWVGYRVPIATRSTARLQFTDVRGRCRLEPPTELVILARLEAKAIVELRAVGVDCDIDAAGMPLVWLDGVDQDQSVAWLASFVSGSLAGWRGNRTMEAALTAIGLHAAPAATRTLISLARQGNTTQLRGRALFWLAQRATDQSAAVIADAIERDPEVEVKRRAVMALAQLPRDEAIPLLIGVARTNKNTEVRRQAMLSLGQTNDPRALEFFEQILVR
jgi:hypothetical protein